MSEGHNRLVIGFDERPGGEDALALGHVLAEVTCAKPVVARVFPWPEYLMGPADLAKALETETEEPFALARDRLTGLQPETRAVADRSPARALEQLATEESATMIVVGSAHRGPVGRTLLGSVGLALLQGAPCSVAVAPKGFAKSGSMGLLRVGVAFDGSAEAWSALETGIGIAERTHAELTLIAVAEPPQYGYSTTLQVLSADGLHSMEKDEKRRILDLALGRVPAELPVKTRILEGLPGKALADVSSEFDLMVCGSRGYGPIRRTLVGSTTQALIAHSTCAVLVLSRGVALDPVRVRTGAAPTTA